MLSLRISPVFVLAPPFTLTRMPKLFLALFGLGIAATLVAAFPNTAQLQSVSTSIMIIGGARELMLGLVPVLVLQLMFGALYIAGRTIDIQSGFGLALLIDPTTRGQMPLIGTIFAYLAGAMFFAMNGHHELLRFFVASLDLVPLGGVQHGGHLAALLSYVFVIFLSGFGVAGGAILALFLTDLAVALLSRTVPQMNALLLGIQVKALLLFFVLPLMVSFSGVLLMQMITTALRTMKKLI